ncbi:MAG: hypothetical protein ACM3S0_02165 [Acidobacteriota bacterium]|jgi:hypothetical protein
MWLFASGDKIRRYSMQYTAPMTLGNMRQNGVRTLAGHQRTTPLDRVIGACWCLSFQFGLASAPVVPQTVQTIVVAQAASPAQGHPTLRLTPTGWNLR